MRSARPAAAALACSVTLLAAGCSLLGGADEPERDASGEVTEAGDADAFAIRVGDCLETLDWEAEGFATFPVVPCPEPHESEVYAATDLPDGDYPGAEAIGEAADAFCFDEFEAFVGTPWHDSTLDFAYLSPTPDSWAGGDREVLCLLMDPEGLTTGSLAGAAR